jgi:DNA-binding NarL/FixJ family response regulator
VKNKGRHSFQQAKMKGSSKQKKAQILIVDDQGLVREGLIRIINRQKDFTCCGAVDGVNAAQKALTTCKPDLVVVDLLLPDGDGLEMVKSLNAQYPSLPMLVISQCDETIYAERALKSGARGFVMKNLAISEIPIAIRTILKGEFYVSSRIATLALHQMAVGKPSSQREGLGNLTDRELQIFQLLGAGVSTRDIAAKLFLSIKTVETHRENIKHKLKLSNAAELVRYSANWVESQSTGIRPRSEKS